ncbi:MAG: ubiquitin-like protein Pup [Bifidobacterium sp.]|uniref:Prokaryotic ubiquitin-like protein Pup n=1 Tax=Bifidobacterium fermentum TaxID=3059035 RepID=A0AB39UGQ5_9BIFI
MPQERSRIVRQAHDDVQEQGSAQRVKGDESNIDELDSVLDDIETSLSENAEEYVNRFVQKGGE